MTKTESVERKLREIILENEGDRDDIYSDVLRFVTPLVDALLSISEPTGAYSKDPLEHANNTIDNCAKTAKSAIESIGY